MAEVTTYSAIANQMIPDLPGADADTIALYLLRAGRKFCADSERYELDVTATLVEGTNTYSLTLADAQVRRIKRVRFLDTDSGDEAKNYNDGREIFVDEFDLVYDTVDQIRLNRGAEPDSGEAGFTVVARVVYVPHIGVDILPDDFLTRWTDAIRYRAMYEMLVLPDRPWTNPEEAQRHRLMYDDEIARARFEVTHDNKTANKTMRAPSFL